MKGPIGPNSRALVWSAAQGISRKRKPPASRQSLRQVGSLGRILQNPRYREAL